VRAILIAAIAAWLGSYANAARADDGTDSWWCATSADSARDQACWSSQKTCEAKFNSSPPWINCFEREIVSLFELTQVNGGRMVAAFPMLSQCERQRRRMMANKIDYRDFTKCRSSAQPAEQTLPPVAAATSLEGILLLPDDNGCKDVSTGITSTAAKIMSGEPKLAFQAWFCSTLSTPQLICGNLAENAPMRIASGVRDAGRDLVLVILPYSDSPAWPHIFGSRTRVWESSREMLVLLSGRYQMRTEAFFPADAKAQVALSVIKLCVGSAVVPNEKDMKSLRAMLESGLLEVGKTMAERGDAR
jgi:hypothetical protein